MVSDPDSGRTVNVAAGELRRDDVKVGGHFALSPGAVPRFMTRFEQVYAAMGRSETILASGTAFCSGRKKKFAQERFRQGQVRSSKPFSSAASCRAVTSPRSWERANARRVVSALLGRGVLSSASTRAPLLITFPAVLAARWMPGLFPEQDAQQEGR